ncbi:MAG: hypothetical protein Q4C85_10575 [Actinomyces sp.]|uniref:hypothetical protein n=1 Tax=Actinomyces sp. TaxID=29317 RepID=UPI0026DD0701|nr:hypothetical protein [Actinomyces sp.]MDO4244183.1 hypothetical protein [Actinomyces sp.]
MPADVAPEDLEASARRQLRALGRANAENVARHLVMVQRLLDADPELAFRHARYAASHAGRVAVVRESAGIAAYLSGHYQEALRDIRAARRLSGMDLHRAIEADCERALGRYDQALKAAKGADPAQLDDVEEAEIAMVVSGIRQEMGHPEVGLMVVEEAIMMFRGDRETLRRLHSVRADRLEELGRLEEAEAVRRRIGDAPEAPDDEVEVFDIEDDYDDGEDREDEQDADRGLPGDAAVTDGPAAGHAEAIEEGGADSPAGPDDEDDRAPGSASEADEALEDDAMWSGSFATRVEAELAEILGEGDPAHDKEE